jgi:hypothetical protein
MATRSLITMMPDMTIINVNPGLCRTNLGREFDLSPSFSIFGTVIWFLATSRSAEKGARNLSHAVVTSSDSVDVSLCYCLVRPS